MICPILMCPLIVMISCEEVGQYSVFIISFCSFEVVMFCFSVEDSL